ncbi:MAG: hypothetical protein NTV11_05425 [Rhodocyclales bacterium]|nr:hypothetical protein [Rhodocyclales bacterium]
MKMPEIIEIRDLLALSDYDLGGRAMAWHIGEQAEKRGIPVNQITQDFAEVIVIRTLAMRANTAKQTALVEALRRAAEHDFEGAGRFMREYLTDQIIQVAALDEAVTGKRRQSDLGKRPPKERTTHKTVTVAAMRPWRRDGHSLAEFMDAASVGSIDGLTIQRAGVSGVERFDVDCDAMEKKKRASMRSLQEWWEAANAD